MAYKFFRPKRGRDGVMVDSHGFGNPGALSPVAVASNTVIYRVATSLGKGYIERIGLLCGTLPTGNSTITIQFFRRRASGSVSAALTAAFDLKAGATALTNTEVPITATENNRYMAEGDYIAYDVVAAGTITQQPVDLVGRVEVLRQE